LISINSRMVRLKSEVNSLNSSEANRCEEWNTTGTVRRGLARIEKVSQLGELQLMTQPSRPGFPGGGLGASRARPNIFQSLLELVYVSGGRRAARRKARRSSVTLIFSFLLEPFSALVSRSIDTVSDRRHADV
jgi:hypothetical protein